MFEEILVKIAKNLDKKQIPYMLIGGQAVLLYGVPRLTEDIDVTLGVDCDREDTIREAILKIGLRIPKEVDLEFVKKTNVLVGIHKKSGIRVDFIFSYTPYEKQALTRIKKQNLKNYHVNFASIEDIIIHKIFASRPRDLEDAKIIVQKNYNRIDFKYIRKWLKEFSSLSEHKEILSNFKKLLTEK